MSNTTDTNTSAASLSSAHGVELLQTPSDIATRLDHWIQTQQVCWVIIATRSGTCMEVSGKLSHSSIGGRSSYRLNDSNFLSNANFLLGAVESVGMTCIFLKP